LGDAITLDDRDLGKLMAALAKAPEKTKLAMRRAMHKTTQTWVGRAKAERFTGTTGPRSLHTRTGRLVRSLVAKVEEVPSGIVGRIGSNVVYAPTHEFGATITPKRSQYLTIPLAAAKTAAGVARFASAKQVPGLIFLTRPGRNPLLVQRDGRGGVIPYYVLVKSVTIPPRLGLRTIRDELVAKGLFQATLFAELKPLLKD